MSRYEIIAIGLGTERVIETHADMGAAFDACVSRWAGYKPAGPIHAVRDAETDQRWSYRDIKDLRPTVAA